MKPLDLDVLVEQIDFQNSNGEEYVIIEEVEEVYRYREHFGTYLEIVVKTEDIEGIAADLLVEYKQIVSLELGLWKFRGVLIISA